MLCDSHSTKPSSSMVGTSPVGFILRYSGVLLTPNCMPASMRSYFSPSSSAAHSAFFTFTELVLPQIFSMVSPKSGTDHVSFLYLFFFNDTATTEIYTLSLHDALPI